MPRRWECHVKLPAFLDAVRAGEMPLVKRPCLDAGSAADLAMADVLNFSAELRGLLKSVGGRVPLGTKQGWRRVRCGLHSPEADDGPPRAVETADSELEQHEQRPVVDDKC